MKKIIVKILSFLILFMYFLTLSFQALLAVPYAKIDCTVNKFEIVHSAKQQIEYHSLFWLEDSAQQGRFLTSYDTNRLVSGTISYYELDYKKYIMQIGVITLLYGVIFFFVNKILNN